MAKLNVKGLTDFSIQLAELQRGSPQVMSAAVYAGSGKMVEAVKTEIQALPTQEGYMRPGDLRDTVTKREKEELLSHVGISAITLENGVCSAAIGFDGYTKTATKKYPGGVPVPLIARSVESGSSVRVKHPFMRSAANKNKYAIQEAMKAAAEAKINEITK